jgi:hypothetical protein
MYKLLRDFRSNQINSVVKQKDDGGVLVIPFAPDNTDYIAYLKWLEEGNEPLPADEGTQ